MQNVPQIKLVLTESVKTHVLVYVESTHTAAYGTMFQFVFVIKDLSETHLVGAEDQRQQLLVRRLLIHVTHPHVDPMLFVIDEVMLLHVSAFQITLETHMLLVTQSVLSMQIVHQINSVEISIVLTHALDFVDQMHIVKLRITCLYVCVTRAT